MPTDTRLQLEVQSARVHVHTRVRTSIGEQCECCCYMKPAEPARMYLEGAIKLGDLTDRVTLNERRVLIAVSSASTRVEPTLFFRAVQSISRSSGYLWADREPTSPTVIRTKMQIKSSRTVMGRRAIEIRHSMHEATIPPGWEIFVIWLYY